tara:strand:- start:3472 stop:5223 length:1752 start_codon:yes stop_codon:yes gene_type:complete
MKSTAPPVSVKGGRRFSLCDGTEGTTHIDPNNSNAMTNYTCACLDNMDKTMRLVALILCIICVSYCIKVLAKPFTDEKTADTNPTSSAEEKKNRSKDRGQAASMFAVLGFNTMSGLIDAKADVNASTSTALIGMLCGGTYGFIMDNAMGSEDGYRTWKTNVSKAMQYGLGTLGSGRYARYFITVMFDMFVSMIIYKPLFETIHELPYFRKAEPFKTNMVCSALVGTLTFMLYTNMTRFQWAYPSTMDEHEGELLGTPEMMLTTAVAGAVFLASNTVTDERLKWVRDLDASRIMKEKIDALGNLKSGRTLEDLKKDKKHEIVESKSFRDMLQYKVKNFKFDVNSPGTKLILFLALMLYVNAFGKKMRSRVDHVVIPDNMIIAALDRQYTEIGTNVTADMIFEKGADGEWVPTTSTESYKVREYMGEESGKHIHRLYKVIPSWKYDPPIDRDAPSNSGNPTYDDIIKSSFAGYMTFMAVTIVTSGLTILGTSSKDPITKLTLFIGFIVIMTILVLPGVIPAIPAYPFWGSAIVVIIVVALIKSIRSMAKNGIPINSVFNLFWPSTTQNCATWLAGKPYEDQRVTP